MEPAKPGDHERAKAEGKEPEEPAGPRGVVWIVDDSPLEAEMARRALAPHYEIELFADGAPVLERLTTDPGPDALVLDWQLPGMSGIDVCRFIRASSDEIALPVIMLTVHGHKQDIVEGLAAGANDYVTKPYDAAELLARVGTLVRTKKLHERAKRAEAQTDAIFEGAPACIGFLDKDLRYLRVNEALAGALGVSRSACIGRPFGEATPEIAPKLKEMFRRVIASGEPIMSTDVSAPAPGLGHAERHFLASYYPVRVEGETVGLAAMMTDITERKRAGQALAFLARASSRLSASLDSRAASESIAALAVPAVADFCCVLLRDGGATLKPVADACSEPERAEILRALAQGHPFVGEATHGGAKVLQTGQADVLPDVLAASGTASREDAAYLEALLGAGVTSWILVPLAVQKRTFGCLALGMLGSGRRFDETDRALAEEIGYRTAVAIDNARLFEMTQRERARVEEANRIKDEFLATVSHELRTPLNAILGWTVMLRSGPMSDEKRSRALETIERNARAQTQLIEDLLDISRIISGKLRLSVSPVQPGILVESALETVRPAADAKGVRIEPPLIDAHIGLILGDPERLQQVVWNLLSNAVKFTPKGGRVSARVAKDGSDVEISVTDTGRGIPPEFLPYVFERFRQADSSIARMHGGLGLGLAITRHLVELHGGSIDAQSPGEGLGATFTVKLPLAPASSGARDRAAEIPDRSRAGELVCPDEIKGLCVFVVEDEEDARELIVSVLESCGAKVSAFSRASEVLEAIRQSQPDVLVSDVGLPGESGYELIQKVRALPPDGGGRTPAVALTAYARMEDRTRALMMGFDMHVPKPIEPAELLVVIAHLASRFSGPKG
jgi:PAS domain S-box-containing protein